MRQFDSDVSVSLTSVREYILYAMDYVGVWCTDHKFKFINEFPFNLY
jgi:hypothetical protein